VSSIRDEWIVNQRLVENRTYSAIGRDVDLSPKRCRDIVRKHQRKAEEKAERDRRHKVRLEALNYWLALLRAIKSAEVQR